MRFPKLETCTSLRRLTFEANATCSLTQLLAMAIRRGTLGFAFGLQLSSCFFMLPPARYRSIWASRGAWRFAMKRRRATCGPRRCWGRSVSLILAGGNEGLYMAKRVGHDSTRDLVTSGKANYVSNEGTPLKDAVPFCLESARVQHHQPFEGLGRNSRKPP